MPYRQLDIEDIVLKAINEQRDPHRAVAAAMFEVTEGEVTAEQRMTAKQAVYQRWYTPETPLKGML